MIDGIGCLVDAVGVIVPEILHRHNVNADTVFLGNRFRHFLQPRTFTFPEKSGGIRHIVQLRSRLRCRSCAHAEGKRRHEHQQEA